MRDLHPELIAGHIALGELISRTEQHESRMWLERNRGLYVATQEAGQPYLSATARTQIAGSVWLLVEALRLESLS